MTQAPSGSMQCSPRAWMCLQDPLTLGLGEWMFSLVGQSPGPQRLTLGSPTALHPNPRPALLQEQDLMTHPGAGPGWAGGGWAEAWSEQRVRGQEPCLHWAAGGDFAGLSTAAPGADCSNWRAAPGQPLPLLMKYTRLGCKSVQKGPLPQVSSHLPSNFRSKVRPRSSCPLPHSPAWWRHQLGQCRQPLLPRPLSPPGCEVSMAQGYQQEPSLCNPSLRAWGSSQRP